MVKSNRSNRIQMILLFFAAMWMALGLNYLIRPRSTPQVLQYIPKESDIVAYTTKIGKFWDTGLPHYNRIFKGGADQEEPSIMTQAFTSLQEVLNDHDVPIDNLEALTRYGFDIHRQIAVGGSFNEQTPKFIIVFPVVDSDDAIAFIQRFFESEDVSEGDLRIGSRQFKTKLLSSNPYLTILAPDPDHILFSTSKKMLARAVQDSQENLIYFQNDNNMRKNQLALTQELQHEALAFLMYWRFTNSHLIQQAAFGLAFSPERIDVCLQSAVNTNTVKVLDDFSKPTNGNSTLLDDFNTHPPLLLAVRDPALSSYINFIRSMGDSGIQKQISQFFGGILLELEQSASVSEIKVSIVGYDGGLPQIVVGIKGEPKALEKIRYTVQKKKRLERDRTIIKNAAIQLPSEKKPDPGDLINVLLGQGFLRHTPQSVWNRYKGVQGDINKAQLIPEDFGKDKGYVFDDNGFECTYLLPAVNQNDIQWRMQKEELDNLDKNTLLDDSYRLCTAFSGGVLWAATDSSVLRQYLQNKPAMPKASEKRSDQRFKIRFSLNINQIVTEGLLNPESDIKEFFDRVLVGFKAYNRIVFDIYPSRSGDNIWIKGEITDDW